MLRQLPRTIEIFDARHYCCTKLPAPVPSGHSRHALKGWRVHDERRFDFRSFAPPLLRSPGHQTGPARSGEPGSRSGPARAGILSMSTLLSYFRDLEPQMVQWLMDLINTDSPSDNKPGAGPVGPPPGRPVQQLRRRGGIGLQPGGGRPPAGQVFGSRSPRETPAPAGPSGYGLGYGRGREAPGQAGRGEDLWSGLL